MFNPVSVISSKRDGVELSQEEIRNFIAGYVDGAVPDYQMAALCMAVYLNGMTVSETRYLTEAMLRSGGRIELPDDGRPVVDKHSTGGLGDKVSLLLAPLLACCNTRVPMISGRGLGITGGTLDKLESIPGFRTRLDKDEIVSVVDRVGCVICGATEDIAPADRKLYQLRDVTGTVASLPLITASILSKKLAESPDALIFDVKTGGAALMTTLESSRSVAESLVDTSVMYGVPARALITDMNQPLGRACGNAVEVKEVLDASQTGEPKDLVHLTVMLAAKLLELVDSNPGESVLMDKLHTGEVHQKLLDMISAQGGRIDDLPVADWKAVTAEKDGYVASIDAFKLGNLLADMGGGRKTMDDEIDHEVGIKVHVSVGDRIEQGDLIAEICHPAMDAFDEQITNTISLSDVAVDPATLIIEAIG